MPSSLINKGESIPVELLGLEMDPVVLALWAGLIIGWVTTRAADRASRRHLGDERQSNRSQLTLVFFSTVALIPVFQAAPLLFAGAVVLYGCLRAYDRLEYPAEPAE